MKLASSTTSRIGIAVALLLPSAASADIVTIGAARDNTLYENDHDSVTPPSNGAGQYMFAGRTNQGVEDHRRGVIYFDIAAAGIPAGSAIDGVTLSLRMSRSILAGDTPVSVHRLLADWGEGASNAATRGG